MSTRVADTPRDLRAYTRIDPPKLKKDYPGQLLRLKQQLQGSVRYDHDTKKWLTQPCAAFPAECITIIHTRDTHEGKASFRIRRICPCCNHEHEQSIPEGWLAEGKAEFVTESGLAPDPETVIYLASPYSHPDKDVRASRWIAACDAAVFLMSQGFIVISPIAAGHPVSVRGEADGIGSAFEHWQAVDMALMSACNTLVVLQIDGWERSVGVSAEVNHARKKGMAVWALADEPEFQIICNPDLTFVRAEAPA